MSTPARATDDSASDPRPAAGPGRPKDLAKRAAILEAAERMFLQQGYEGVSMDQIAAEAGVSKLTVYSHFGDKDTLFTAAAAAYCEQQMPASVFEPAPDTPVRQRLLEVADAFFTMISAPEAVAGHRLLCTPQMVEKRLAQRFWEGGPLRVQAEFAALLQRRIEHGDLDIDDPAVAAAQFFVLVKGDLHQRMVFDCDADADRCAELRRAHLEASVDMFLRAYGRER
ncbi:MULTISPECIES: TetR/AcrR family transcriptional regulator [Luteimonas]|uniref:TetR/AcrR family transcriptional regulator n=1 Tax=Luteimonas TaxID=83614 RepID=UPI000C7E2375|nr:MULTISPECIES: TetR/AcrR family transcriptional regulator [Luteimonas]